MQGIKTLARVVSRDSDAKIITFASGHKRRKTGIFHDAKI